MKAAAGCMLIGCFFSAGIRAQESGRYATPQFFKVKTVYSIPYSRATSIGKTSPDTLYLDFYEPLRDTLAARPLVIVVFGGSFVAGSRNNDDNVAYCKRLATYGYATASIDYRLMPLLNISAKNIVRDAYMAIQDVSAAVRFFKANHQTYRIDTNNIFLLGNSAGSIAILHEIYTWRMTNVLRRHANSRIWEGCIQRGLKRTATVPPEWPAPFPNGAVFGPLTSSPHPNMCRFV